MCSPNWTISPVLISNLYVHLCISRLWPSVYILFEFTGLHSLQPNTGKSERRDLFSIGFELWPLCLRHQRSREEHKPVCGLYGWNSPHPVGAGWWDSKTSLTVLTLASLSSCLPSYLPSFIFSLISFLWFIISNNVYMVLSNPHTLPHILLYWNLIGRIFHKPVLFCIFPGWKTKDEIPKLVSDYTAKKFSLDPLITHTLALNKINEAVQLMKNGQW